MDAVTSPPVPTNEPVRVYRPGSSEATSLLSAAHDMSTTSIELTCTIDGQQRMAEGDPFDVVAPHRHDLVLGTSRQAGRADVSEAIDAALRVAPSWRAMSFDVARPDQRRDHARTVQDHVSGRDRLGV